jgi:rod shape determining protein RodA
MVIGLAPVVGVPLPLVSYGGSSLLTCMLGIGLLMNISMRRYVF